MKTLRLGIWLHLLLAAAVGIALAFAVMWMGVQVTLDRYVRDEFGTEAVQVESVLQSYYAVLGLRAAEDIAREVVAKSGGQVILRSSGQVVLNVHRSSRTSRRVQPTVTGTGKRPGMERRIQKKAHAHKSQNEAPASHQCPPAPESRLRTISGPPR